ncbi:nitric oxide reductase activation protein NorD [Nocardia miyunensis]|uniref:nitric oxide reductase activation protein NorD n=1 Tax=Nocardia miyunensis TaxID=282684 RepID=UPI0008321730|nr:VWA domain-containing protein [Nocardia miyunensis]
MSAIKDVSGASTPEHACTRPADALTHNRRAGVSASGDDQLDTAVAEPGSAPPAVAGDVARFGFLASAIAARPLAVLAGEAATTYTDGRTIFVDPAADAVDVRDAVALHAALLAGGSLRKSTVARLARHRKAVAARYLSLEAVRIGVQFGRLLPPATVERIASLRTRKVSADSAESLRRALSGESIPEPPAWTGVVKVLRLLRSDAAELGGEPTDDDLAGRTPIHEQPELSEDDAEDSEESKILKLFSAPGVNNPFGDMLQRLLGMGRKAAGKNEGGGELSVAGERIAPVGARGKRTTIDRLLSAVFDATPAAGIRYPEWNSTKGEYRHDWCLVAEYQPGEPDTPTAAALGSNESLRRPLARVGIESERHRRQPDGDSLDLSALVDYETSRRLGDDPEPRIYENTRSTRRDMSVVVLLDASGSTAEGEGEDTVFEQERQLACDLTASLESLGDRVATYGFYSRGKDSVRFLRVKTFPQRFDAPARRRLAAVQPSGFTRLGAAIRHSTAVLLQQAQAKNMVLIVIGDGLPYDDGYEGRYARDDTHQAIGEAMRSGVGVVGLGIRSSTDPAVLEHIWSDAPFRVFDTAGDVRRHLRALLLDALAMTRSNGRQREVSSTEQRTHLRALHAARRKNSNTYV